MDPKLWIPCWCVVLVFWGAGVLLEGAPLVGFLFPSTRRRVGCVEFGFLSIYLALFNPEHKIQYCPCFVA